MAMGVPTNRLHGLSMKGVIKWVLECVLEGALWGLGAFVVVVVVVVVAVFAWL